MPGTHSSSRSSGPFQPASSGKKVPGTLATFQSDRPGPFTAFGRLLSHLKKLLVNLHHKNLPEINRPTDTGKGSLGPFFCNHTSKFNPDGVTEIRPALIRLWPNIHGQDTEDSLWKHEWDKHGTCAALDSQLSSEHLYFNQGIQWVYILEKQVNYIDKLLN